MSASSSVVRSNGLRNISPKGSRAMATQKSLGCVLPNGLRDTTPKDDSEMATCDCIPPPPQFSDYASLEEINSNPIYQPPGHWLRELPYLDEIVNTDNAKYLHAELKKHPYSRIATTVFGVVRVIEGWCQNSLKQYTRFEYSPRMQPSEHLNNNNIPYGRVHQCVIPSRLEGRIDVKWSTFHSLKKQELINKVRSVKGEGAIPELFLNVCTKMTIKELIRELIQT